MKVIQRVQHFFGGGHRPLKFGRAKTSKIRCDLKQKLLLSLIANISEMDTDVDKGLTALSCRIPQELDKNSEFTPTNKKLISAHVIDPP